MTTMISKAFRSITGGNVTKASRGTMTSYVLGAPHQYGQPYEFAASVADIQGLVTPDRMREIVMKTPTAGAAMNAVLDYVAGVEIDVRNVDAAKKVSERKKAHIDDYMRRPNTNDTWRRYRLKVFRDMFTLGWSAVEKEYDAEGNIANLWPLDAARLRVDYDEHGTVLGYNMLDVHGFPISKNGTPWAWSPTDLITLHMNPTTHSMYSTSRIAQLFTLAVVEDMMVHFISQRFTDSNVPYGLLDLGEITQEELRAAVDMWNSQANKEHKIMLTGSKGSHWYPFAYNLKDLEAPLLLADIRSRIMGIVGVTMNELGESQDVNKSNGYNLSYTFKKRAIEPLLDEFCTVHTQRFLWDSLGFNDTEFYYAEIDSRDELLQAEIDKIYVQLGVDSPNDIANRKGKPSVAGGDDRLFVVGATAIPIDMIRPFAEAQLAALLMVQQEGATDGNGPKVKPPLIRPPVMPEQGATPDARGSSGVKVQYPRNIPQSPRGPVQSNRAAGNRKDDTH